MVFKQRSAPLALVFAVSLPVMANEDAPFALEELIVTAQKRAESLQEVPAAVSAFGAEDIENAGWSDINQLQHAMPSVAVGGESAARPYVFIRGIGTRKFDIGADGSVGIFVDEIFNARFSSTLTGILDLERIEVLKGPQGTLYGRNTIGGAISMYTRQPGNEFEGKLKAAAGSDGYYLLSGSTSGALVEDKLTGRISLATSDEDGVYEDTVSGKTDNNRSTSARFTLLATPSDKLELSLTGELNKIKSDAVLTEPLVANTGVVAVSPLIPSQHVAVEVADNQSARYRNAFTDPGYLERDNNLLALKAKWIGESVDFTSITSRTEEDYKEGRDFDGSAMDIWNHYVDQDSTQYSQEFRLSSVDGGAFTFDDKLQWVAGIYYFTDDAYRSDSLPFGPDSALSPAMAAVYSAGALIFPGLDYNVSTSIVEIETTSYALYGQATYAVTPELGLTLGLRYTDDKKEYTYSGRTNTPGYSPAVANFDVGDTLNYASTDPRITVDYQVAEDVMAYITYASGFKSGGVQFSVTTAEAAQQSFDEETLTMYEVGLKSMLWNQRLQLNAALYRYHYEDQQVQSIISINGSPTALTQNAGKSNMNGFEIDIVAMLTPHFTVEFGYTYQDAEFDEFSSIDGDRAGNKMAYAPDHAANIGFNYLIPLNDGGEVTLQGQYSWKDDYYFDFDNSEQAHQDNYGVINLSAWWDLADGKTRLRAFCNNCGDEEYLNNVTIFPGTLGGGGRQSWAAPRRFGVEVTYRY